MNRRPSPTAEQQKVIRDISEPLLLESQQMSYCRSSLGYPQRTQKYQQNIRLLDQPIQDEQTSASAFLWGSVMRKLLCDSHGRGGLVAGGDQERQTLRTRLVFEQGAHGGARQLRRIALFAQMAEHDHAGRTLGAPQRRPNPEPRMRIGKVVARGVIGRWRSSSQS